MASSGAPVRLTAGRAADVRRVVGWGREAAEKEAQEFLMRAKGPAHRRNPPDKPRPVLEQPGGFLPAGAEVGERGPGIVRDDPDGQERDAAGRFGRLRSRRGLRDPRPARRWRSTIALSRRGLLRVGPRRPDRPRTFRILFRPPAFWPCRPCRGRTTCATRGRPPRPPTPQSRCLPLGAGRPGRRPIRRRGSPTRPGRAGPLRMPTSSRRPSPREGR